MARVFLSYASGDREAATSLHARLSADGHEVFLDRDPADGIAVGDYWQQRLHERLRWADALVPLLTTRYLASLWCTAELGIAISRGARVLPVRLEPAVSHPLLDGIQSSDADGAGVVVALRRLEAAGGAGWRDDRSPFPGLQAFDVDQHRVFFGRGEETAQLAGRLRSPAEGADGAVLLVVGPSGCGKSSLVRAGLIPAMAVEPQWWVLPPMSPGNDPVSALTLMLARAGRRLGLDWNITDVRARLDGAAGLREMVDELLLAADAQRLLIVLDQAEELLTQATPAGREQFAALLRTMLRAPVRVIGTIRPEYFEKFLADPTLLAVPLQTFPLRPLSRDALRLVVEGPLRVSGIGIDAGLVARLTADTGTGEALPLLAFTLAQLTAGVTRGGRVDAARYGELGGVPGAIAQQADTAMAEARAAGSSDDEVFQALLRLVNVDEDGRLARRSDDSTGILDTFVARRLLTTDKDPQTGRVVLSMAHEAFLAAWPPLAAAIADAGTALRAARRVEQATADWVAAGRNPAHLWQRGRLAAAEAEIGPKSRAIELSPQAKEFLRVGIRRDRMRRGRAVFALSFLLVLALAAAAVAFVQRAEAREQQRAAVARGLAIESERLRATQPELSLRLILAARSISPEVSLTAALAGAYPAGLIKGSADDVAAVFAFSPDGSRLAVARAGTVELWDIVDARQPRRLSVLREEADALAFTGSGNVVVVSDEAGVALWMEQSGRMRRIAKMAGDWGRPMVTPDGQTLVTFRTGVMRLWDIRDPKRPLKLADLPVGAVDAADISADGRFLAAAEMTDPENSVGGRTAVWNIADPRRARRVTGVDSGDTTYGVALSSDGHVLGTMSLPGDVLGHGVFWDLKNPSAPRKLSELEVGDVNGMAFNPAEPTLATDAGAGESQVLLWDMSKPAQPRRVTTLSQHGSAVSAIKWSANGRLLGVGMADAQVQLWLTAPAQAATADPVAEACRLAQGGLTREQWRAHVPDLPFEQGCA